MKNITKYKKGFTLIETLVAISILAIAIVAPMTLASKTLFTAQYAKDQMVATQLAQEAIEIVRAKRDAKMIEAFTSFVADRGVWLDNFRRVLTPTVGSESNVVVDVADLNSIERCDSIDDDECSAIFLVGGLYRQAAFLTSSEKNSGKPTRFKRIVHLKVLSENELQVRAIVKWQTGSFLPRAVSAETVVYNWIPKQE